jgi:hypothetical protein
MLTPHPLLMPRLRKISAIPPLTLWVLLSLLRGSIYLLPFTKQKNLIQLVSLGVVNPLAKPILKASDDVPSIVLMIWTLPILLTCRKGDNF